MLTQPLGGAAAEPAGGGSGGPTLSLFAFPAYDNFSGRMRPSKWVRQVQAKSTEDHQWKVSKRPLRLAGQLDD